MFEEGKVTQSPRPKFYIIGLPPSFLSTTSYRKSLLLTHIQTSLTNILSIRFVHLSRTLLTVSSYAPNSSLS